VAAQMNLLGFSAFAGTQDNPGRLRRPNIRAANGSGPAYLAPEAFAVFRSLGLVFDGSWTEAAETILWRECPEEWAFDFTEDERFFQARDHASTTIPPDIVIKVAEAVVIREQDIVDWLAIPERHARGRKTRKDALDACQFLGSTRPSRHIHQTLAIERWLAFGEPSQARALH
jgi:pellino protein